MVDEVRGSPAQHLLEYLTPHHQQASLYLEQVVKKGVQVVDEVRGSPVQLLQVSASQ